MKGGKGKTMSILIKGMEMPTSCMDCPFKGFDRVGGRGNICTIDDSITLHAVLDGLDVKFVRMGDCPLVPVPSHGRLIDADALLNELQELFDRREEDARFAGNRGAGVTWNDAIFSFKVAPIIIPAEEGE